MRQLPPPLRALFTAPAGWLKQLTPVKLSCLAQAYCKMCHENKWPWTEPEDVLIKKMEASIQVCVSLFLMEP